MTHLHLPPWTIDQLAEGTLSHAERTLAEAHAASCPECASELQAARQLVVALEALPRFSPSAEFSELVMARVELHPAAAPALARRWLPQTRKGWMTLLAALLLPLLPLVPLFAWLFSRPGVTPGSLWGMGRRWATETAWSFLVDAAEAALRSPLAQWVVTQGETIPGGYVTLVLLGAAALLTVPVSAWVMVRILRAPTGGVTHA